MAILKAINYKQANRAKLIETLDYVANREKNSSENYSQIIYDFKLDAYVNRILHGQEGRKRQFKQFVISFQQEWPHDRTAYSILKDKLNAVSSSVEMYFSQMGYLSNGFIHTNTLHPHIHFIVETCNALTGKQFSQSPSELTALKLYVDERLKANGLEGIIHLREISENELLEQEDADVLFDKISTDDSENFDDDVNDDFAGDVLNYEDGTVERRNIDPLEDCRIDDSSHGCHDGKISMCEIIDDKREMCTIMKEMCRIITDEESLKQQNSETEDF